MAARDLLYRLIRWSWLVHGLLLLVLVGVLAIAGQQTQTAEWADAMQALGFAHLVQPVRAAVAAVNAYLAVIAAIGVLCMVGAALSWSGRWRWPLQSVAVAHFVLLPLATWWGHGVILAIGLGGIEQTVSELVTVTLGLAAVVASLVIVHRHRSPDSLTSPVEPAEKSG